MAAPKKIGYFTTGPVPTANEKADIDAFAVLASQGYEFVIRNGAAPQETANPEDFDYVSADDSGAIPAAYANTGDFPRTTPEAPPAGGNLSATQVLVSTGQKLSPITVTGSGTFATFTIAAGKITAIALSSS